MHGPLRREGGVFGGIELQVHAQACLRVAVLCFCGEFDLLPGAPGNPFSHSQWEMLGFIVYLCTPGSYRVVERVMVQIRGELRLFVLEQFRFCLQHQQSNDNMNCFTSE